MDLPEGFDPRPALLRTASVAVGRVLSRFALNNIDPGSRSDGAYKLLGLARYYDGNFGGAAADPQVIKATDPLSLAQVRRLMRKVTPSESGYGAGPNALVTSLRCRDLLISLERAADTSPDFRLDPRTNEVRYHLDGVPVYVGPLREDEDTAGAAPAFKTTGEPYTYNRTSIYALRLGGFSGVRMLHFGGDSAKYGVQIDEITPSAGNAALGYQVHGYYALFIPERQACARLWGIDISAEV